jgi:PadR family transcriptional regulator, regulatory protein PadR
MLKHVKSDLPQGTLDLLILKVVALGPVHGYSIAQRLQQVSRDVVQVPQGSLYPALHRMENRGLLAAEWTQTQTGRDAKFYRLTRKGKAQLDADAASWNRLTGAVGLILKMSGVTE